MSGPPLSLPSSQTEPYIPKSTPPSTSPVNQQEPQRCNFSPSYGPTGSNQLPGPPLLTSSSQAGANIPQTSPPSASTVNQPGSQSHNFLSSLGSVPSSKLSGPQLTFSGSQNNIPRSSPLSASPVNHQSQNKSEIFSANQADSTRKSPGVPLNSQLSFRESPAGSLTGPPTSSTTSSIPETLSSPLNAPPMATLSAQASRLPSAYEPSGASQFSKQPPVSLSGTMIPNNAAQSAAPVNHNSQLFGQNRSEIASSNQADFAEKSPGMPFSSQPPIRRPPLRSFTGPSSAASDPQPTGTQTSGRPWENPSEPNYLKSTSQSVSPVTHQNHVSSQNKSETGLFNEAEVTGKPPGMPLSSQQPLRGPSLPGLPQGTQLSQPPTGIPPNSTSNSLSSSRPNLSGLPGHNLHSPPPVSQQSLSRPPLPGQTSNLSGPPLPGHLTTPYGQQGLHTQYQYGNQMPEQRRFSPNPSIPGHQQNTMNSYGHSNQLADTSYSQGYLQNYGQTFQNVRFVIVTFLK